jgi:hypothetical protein
LDRFLEQLDRLFGPIGPFFGPIGPLFGPCFLGPKKLDCFLDPVFGRIFFNLRSVLVLTNFTPKVASKTHVKNNSDFEFFSMPFLHRKALIFHGRYSKHALSANATHLSKKSSKWNQNGIPKHHISVQNRS